MISQPLRTKSWIHLKNYKNHLHKNHFKDIWSQTLNLPKIKKSSANLLHLDSPKKLKVHHIKPMVQVIRKKVQNIRTLRSIK